MSIKLIFSETFLFVAAMVVAAVVAKNTNTEPSGFIKVEDSMTGRVQQNFYLAISVLIGVIISGIIDVCVACCR